LAAGRTIESVFAGNLDAFALPPHISRRETTQTKDNGQERKIPRAKGIRPGMTPPTKVGVTEHEDLLGVRKPRLRFARGSHASGLVNHCKEMR